ncbi:hypothetical protein AB833_13045 [Chromatiales bacterium (ex Bugula neritina AB1)]|nr:hypothetical protein AB833_13045 [Chromatiales bacterium (ex Bugula neritina AB1)]
MYCGSNCVKREGNILTGKLQFKVLAVATGLLLSACTVNPKLHPSSQTAAENPVANGKGCCNCESDGTSCGYVEKRYQYYLGMLTMLFAS